ncbi:MAG: septum formation inhibitor Maf [Devosia sp.]|nr:septum formation inhibitor Maf [Devosia sp.]
MSQGGGSANDSSVDNVCPVLILASASPTRKALLAGAALDFAVEPAKVDERAIEAQSLLKNSAPDVLAMSLATAKALDVGGRFHEAIIIGADQVLALDGVLFHKPTNRAEAADQLDRLAGKTHQLYSAAVLTRGREVLWSTVESARLTMRDFDAAERDAVLDHEGDAALGSVGAYRLEGASVRLFAAIEGDYFTILGLPLLALLGGLRQVCPELMERFT